ncbi:MAG TPA: hypothetical protein VHM90_02395 [Phycisphaerae bacterium]|nr:hypothetical protein [Phycisphaerae bacterium]
MQTDTPKPGERNKVPPRLGCAAACLAAILVAGCGGSNTTRPAAGPQPGMKKYAYLTALGGPHLLLPVEAAAEWKGSPPPKDGATRPDSDFQRACLATALDYIAVLKVGTHDALVFNDPAASAWAKSTSGELEIYVLKSFVTTDLDGLVDKARAAPVPMNQTGKSFTNTGGEAYLMFAGDTVANAAYDLLRVPLPAGVYHVTQGEYAAGGEKVWIYRLVPGIAPATQPATTTVPATP